MGQASRATLWVTRPGEEARRWAEALCQQGLPAVACPLIEIVTVDAPEALQALDAALQEALDSRVHALMFVSANAVRAALQRPLGEVLRQSHLLAWATGPGTRQALMEAGWPAERIEAPDDDAPQWDSEALWTKVSSGFQSRMAQQMQAHRRPLAVLIVRGADAQGQLAGRQWLAEQLQAAGAEVRQCMAYQRRVPDFAPELARRMRAALHDGSWWLVSSSDAVQQWMQAWPDIDFSQARALATHERIAARLQALGWGRVETVPAALAAQVESIKCLQ